MSNPLNTILSFRQTNTEPMATSSAKVVDGRLVLSLMNAVKPVVWQFDISVVQSSAIELRETNGGETTLVIKSPNQPQHDIASFETPAAAMHVLGLIGRAMERAMGQMHTTQSGTYPPPAIIPQPLFTGIKGAVLKGIGNILMTFLVLFLLVIAIIWFIPLSGSPDQQQYPSINQSEQNLIQDKSNTTTLAPAGTSQSADEFLNAQ